MKRCALVRYLTMCETEVFFKTCQGRAEISQHICQLIRKMCPCAGLLENICWENGGPLPEPGYLWTRDFAHFLLYLY